MSLIKLWHKKNGSHQTKKYLLPIFTAVCVAALFFTSCANSTDSIDSSDSKKETFTITVKTQNITSKTETKNRSAFPALSDSEYYTLSYKTGESESWKSLDGTFPDYQMIIIPGTYTLKLDVYSDAGKTNHILTGNNSLTVTSGMENADVSFILQPPENSTGNGSVSLVLSAETDTQITTFEINSDKSALTLTWTKDDTETSYTKGTITADSVPTGTYHLTIYGKTTTDETVYVRSETLTVWEGLESSVWIFADGTSSNELKIKPDDLYSTFYVKGSSGTYNFYTADGIFGNVEASDTNSGSIDNPLQTVSAAVKKCVFSGMPYTIYVDGTVSEVSDESSDPTAISITNGKNITIKSVNPSGGTKPVIQGDGNGRIIFASGTVFLEDLVLKGGGKTNFGGGIYVDSTGVLTMKNCTITDCNATNFGGGIYLTANATLIDCTFSGNTATNGKALYLQNGTLNLNGKIQSGTDDFYITTGKTITIQSPLSTDSSIVVTPSDYTVGTQILQAGTGENLENEVNKFKVSDDKWLISSIGILFSLETTSLSAEDNIAIFTNIPAGCEATVNLDNLSQTDWQGQKTAEIKGDVTLTAATETTIQNYATSVFTVKSGGTLTLNSNVTLQTTYAGITVTVEDGGTLVLDGATITSTSTMSPTGVQVTNGTLIINSGKVTGLKGSPIVATNSIVTITGGEISTNNSNVKLTNCQADISDLTVSGNSTMYNGGGIKISGDGEYTFKDCKITNNSTTYGNGENGYGGGIYIDTTGTVTFTNCTITGNTAKDNLTSSKGGGIYLKSGTLTTTGCTISSNTTTNGTAEVTGSGSQIYAVAGSVYNEETLKEDMIIDTYSE